MVHDSVREELALKISPIRKQPVIETIVSPPVPQARIEWIPPQRTPVMSAPAIPEIQPQEEARKTVTAQIRVKQTVPTLVEFHSKTPVIPEWRLQLQNTIRRRTGEHPIEETSPSVAVASVPQRISYAVAAGGNTAATSNNRIETPVMINPKFASNPVLAKAMQRIELSRQQYYAPEIQPIAEYSHTAAKRSSVNFQSRQDISPRVSDFVTSGELPTRLVRPSEPRAKFDTNKLPPLPDLGEPTISITKVDLNIDDESDLLEIHRRSSPVVAAYQESASDSIETEEGDDVELETDDFAPISLRFNSAIFDLIIGSFASLIFLSPFMLMSGKFFSLEGTFAFVATWSIVMFIYLTTTIGLLGKTFGMKLFSLEIIDIEENDYPTLHQAAVSSAVYLLSLALGGLGFLTLIINNENRAAHDLISGTIVVREY